jgi:beta-fructofuranosidase
MTGAEETEPLRVRIWRDNSVLEVFVNERTAISTRLYAAEETVGIRFFADDSSATSNVESASAASSQLLGATIWDGIAA